MFLWISIIFLSSWLSHINLWNNLVKKNNDFHYSFLCNYNKKDLQTNNYLIEKKIIDFYSLVYKQNKECKTKDCYISNIKYWINYILNKDWAFILNDKNIEDINVIYKIFKALNEKKVRDVRKYRPLFIKEFKKTNLYKNYYSNKWQTKNNIKSYKWEIKLSNNNKEKIYEKLLTSPTNWILKQINIDCTKVEIKDWKKSIIYNLKDKLNIKYNFNEINANTNTLENIFNNINKTYICIFKTKQCILNKKNNTKVKLADIQSIYKNQYFPILYSWAKFADIYSWNLKDFYIIDYIKSSFKNNINNIKDNKEYLQIENIVKLYKIITHINKDNFPKIKNKIFKNKYFINFILLLHYFDSNNKTFKKNTTKDTIKEKEWVIKKDKKNENNKEMTKKITKKNTSKKVNKIDKKTKEKKQTNTDNHFIYIIIWILTLIITIIGWIFYYLKKKIDF